MKRLHYQIPHNLSVLHDELLAAIPALAPRVSATGNREPILGVEGDDANVWLTVPDDTDEAAISEVVQSHDPAKETLDSTRQRRARIEELLIIGRSNWTASQRNELLELVAQGHI